MTDPHGPGVAVDVLDATPEVPFVGGRAAADDPRVGVGGAARRQRGIALGDVERSQPQAADQHSAQHPEHADTHALPTGKFRERPFVVVADRNLPSSPNASSRAGPTPSPGRLIGTSPAIDERLAGLHIPVTQPGPVGSLDVQPVVAVPGPPLLDMLGHQVIVGW